MTIHHILLRKFLSLVIQNFRFTFCQYLRVPPRYSFSILLAHYPLLPYTHDMATMEDKRKDLTNVQKKFADEYLLDPSDGGAAYLRANPKLSNKKSASVAASKLLKMPKMQDHLKDQVKSYLGVMEARILQNVEFWLDIRDGKAPGMGEGKLIPLSKVQEILTHSSEKINKQITELDTFEIPYGRIVDRMKASENLGKYMQMFVEKKEIDITSAVTIVDDIK